MRRFIHVSTAFKFVVLLLPIGGTPHAQSMAFPGHTSPALKAVAAPTTGTPGHPSQLLDSTGHAFTLTYDTSGRLKTVKKTTGRNIANMQVRYDASGRIEGVRFDNRYELVFHYRNDGTQEIRDSLGGRLVRTGSPWVMQSTADPSGYLVETLGRVEQLFSYTHPVPGLNPPTGSSSPQSN